MLIDPFVLPTDFALAPQSVNEMKLEEDVKGRKKKEEV
jgi:hypothetical protein